MGNKLRQLARVPLATSGTSRQPGVRPDETPRPPPATSPPVRCLAAERRNIDRARRGAGLAGKRVGCRGAPPQEAEAIEGRARAGRLNARPWIR